MARLPDPTNSLSPEATALYEEMRETRGGRIDGMYRTMLYNPDLTRHVSQLGTYLRFKSPLPADVRETAILFAARELEAQYEWIKHEARALEAGVPEEVVDQIRKGGRPGGNHPLYRDAVQAVDCALARRSIPEDLQDRLANTLGVSGIVELVVIAGFYALIAGVLFAFDVPLPRDGVNRWEAKRDS